jgi:hypothetical protein
MQWTNRIMRRVANSSRINGRAAIEPCKAAIELVRAEQPHRLPSGLIPA